LFLEAQWSLVFDCTVIDGLYLSPPFAIQAAYLGSQQILRSFCGVCRLGTGEHKWNSAEQEYPTERRHQRRDQLKRGGASIPKTLPHHHMLGLCAKAPPKIATIMNGPMIAPNAAAACV
jgi:hypothetical protein